MANEVMYKAITGIDDKLITDAYTASRKKRSIKPMYSIGALAACLLLVFTAIFTIFPKNTEVYLYNEKVSSSPCSVTSPLSVASANPRATHQELVIPFDIKLSGETRITCSEGTITLCGKNQDTLFYTGNEYLADSYVASKPLSLTWEIDTPDETKSYTLTFEGKKTQVLTLSFDEDTLNWSVFIEK